MAEPSSTAPTTPKGAVTVQEPTRLQQQLARRMAESRAIVPDWTLALPVDLEAAQTACNALEATTLVDAVLRAVGLALRVHPKLNGGYRDGRFERYERVNVAVAVPSAEGLAFPTLLDADRLGLEELAARRAALAQRVADGALTQPDQAGATCTVYDFSATRLQSVTPVITPPQAVALALGGVGPRAVVRDGMVTARLTADLTVACDARLLHGPDAAAFAATIASLLEDATAL